jgi:hypothetical protein
MKERYKELSGKHLTVTTSRELSGDSVLLTAQTVESQVSVAVAARITLWRGNASLPADYRLIKHGSRIGHDIAVAIGAGESVTVEKVATFSPGVIRSCRNRPMRPSCTCAAPTDSLICCRAMSWPGPGCGSGSTST